ncbi:DGQHR domain-containing protein [Clostridium sp. C1]|uniref:DGQHR domain-containing protein n=1 Tax=Clostridium sp. C1 TaxID=1155388 RepID=UPI001BA4E00F|nr:DGQHR domain-containing protein [Clostridium sp. C1]QUN11950.1 DGQHR domain-containing protein [Clostridium sp. C1]
MKIINQKCNCKIIQDSKTVNWLVENTHVRTFNTLNFTGYQRKVNENHVLKIVDYLIKNDFYMPTSIICSSDKEVKEDTQLSIVDGQHRIEAFKRLKEIDEKKYQEIEDFELSVIILEKPSEELEVDTFITINKTSRKVDTSLAYILKNKINRRKKCSDDLTIAKKEFLAVELATDINIDKNTLWYNKILLEGNPTHSSCETISLNSFVRSVRVFVSYLNKYNIIDLNWKNETELEEIKSNLKFIFLELWNVIQSKWPKLFNSNNNIIQGNIGVSSLNKYIIMQMKGLESNSYSIEEFNSLVKKWIVNLNVDETPWLKGNEFSIFSSESGCNIIAKNLLNLYEN